MKKVIVAGLSILALEGCATTKPAIAVSVIGGKYYFRGKDCVQYQATDVNSIQCMNNKGQITYTVDGLTADQAEPIINQMLAEQAAKQAQQARDLQMLTQSIQQLGRSAQSWGQQYREQAQQYSAPVVQSIGSYGTNGVTYSDVGGALLGSNGVSYRRVGQSVIGSDGTTCQIVGQNIICH